jgi:hypothetical protein
MSRADLSGSFEKHPSSLSIDELPDREHDEILGSDSVSRERGGSIKRCRKSFVDLRWIDRRERNANRSQNLSLTSPRRRFFVSTFEVKKLIPVDMKRTSGATSKAPFATTERQEENYAK